MKTTNSKSNLVKGQTPEYRQNAAKQIRWTVDIGECHISVPINEVDKATENLMVQHFINAGFFIQTCIPSAPPQLIFDPEIRLKLPAEKIAPVGAVFKIGDRFRVKSTECELEIVVMEIKEIHLKYTNRVKHNLLSSEDMLLKNLRWELWERV